MSAGLFVGIDGGGSRTTAVVCDDDGEERARIEGGPALVDPTAPAAAAAALADLARRALAATDAEPPVASLCCGLAGAGRQPERDAVARALGDQDVARHVRVVTDAEAALHDAFADGVGLLLVAGTGSIAWGRGPDGRTARVGGWGTLLGDEGSGYALGLDALRAAARAHDGRGLASALLRRVVETTGVDRPEALIRWAAGAGKDGIAALAPVVIAAADADADDVVARQIVRGAADDLAAHVVTLHRRLEPWDGPAPLALAGGLLLPGRPLRPHALAALDRRGLPVDLLERAVDAARGAAALARSLT